MAIRAGTHDCACGTHQRRFAWFAASGRLLMTARLRYTGARKGVRCH